jgi:hypothetical protein
MAEAEEDLTNQYNTPLTPDEETRYQEWAKQNHREGDSFDYDMRGAWKEGIQADPSTGHFPDTYKKPNHPTFSDESQYHGADGRMGGHWKYDETGSETLQPYSERYEQGGKVEKIQQQMDDPEHGSWHDDGQHHIYTPHPSFFAEVEPQDLVDHFDQHHPADHRLNLP